MPLDRRAFIGGAAAAMVYGAAGAAARPIRIGILTDMSGPFSGHTGTGSVLATQMAIEDFAKGNPGFAVELYQADLQLKPDIAVSIAREWLDNRGVDVITDTAISSAALAIADLVRQRDKIAVMTSAGSSELTGKKCGPNHIHYIYDSWSVGKAMADAVSREGGRSWYFITADYSFGKTLQTEMAGFIEQAGGKVVGNILTPFPGTTDFSSYLLQAQASGAQIIGLATAGADTINCIKQAADFGITGPKGQKIAATLARITDIHAIGIEKARGTLLTEPFYWNFNAGTRAFGLRYAARNGGKMPNAVQAGQYSAVIHYLKAVAALGPEKASSSGRAVVEQMKAMPINDPIFGKGTIRKDGRALIDAHLFEVKAPSESREPWDYFSHRQTIPGADGFRPLDQGGCSLI